MHALNMCDKSRVTQRYNMATMEIDG